MEIPSAMTSHAKSQRNLKDNHGALLKSFLEKVVVHINSTVERGGVQCMTHYGELEKPVVAHVVTALRNEGYAVVLYPTHICVIWESPKF